MNKKQNNLVLPLDEHQQLILFDGVCNLCNASVQYIIKHDKKDKFRFTALQSELGQNIMKQFNRDHTKLDSILLYIPDGGLWSKSSAALKIASQLGFPRNFMQVFFVVPKFIRNWAYDYIAKNRYRWYGKKTACMVPTPEIKSKFL